MKLPDILIIGLLAISASSAFAYKGDAAAGEARATACAACHGQGGNSTIPINPSLAGQNYTYLERALLDYRSGARKNAIMGGQAAGLSDEDIANLAKYYSSQAGALVDLKFRRPHGR